MIRGILVLLLLAGCATPPRVTTQPNIKAIRSANTRTRSSITIIQNRLSEIDKTEGRVSDHLKAAASDLDTLLQSK